MIFLTEDLWHDNITEGEMAQSPGQPMLENEINDCIQDCLNCHTVCMDTAMGLLQKGGTHTEHIKSMLDCSELCLTVAHFMLRDSPFYGEICQTCADVCNHCGELCEQMGEQDCANACRVCSQSCAQLARLVP